MNFTISRAISPKDVPLAVDGFTKLTHLRPRRPCDTCRRRKSRCEVIDDELPCLLCRFHRQECTFKEEPQPRKRRATAGVEESGISSRVQSQHFPEHAYNTTESSPQDTPKIRMIQPIDDYEKLKGPTLMKRTLGFQTTRHSRLIGPTSEFESVLLELQTDQVGDETAVGISTLRKVDSTDTTFILSPDMTTHNHPEDIPDLDAIETIVAPHGQALLHLYFRIVHPSFPILHKKVFLEKYARTHREFSPPCLAGVYLLALNWWSYSSELALLPKPDVSRLEVIALRAMSNVIHRPKLSTIQAGLLLLQRPNGDSWALTSQLVAIGQDLGLQLDCSEWSIPSWERGLRKRLAWAIFMQDKWGALVHGRPSHLTPADWDAQPLQHEDFPENATDEDDEDGSAEVEKGKSLFCEMIKLTQVLALILTCFYTLHAEREFRTRASEGTRWILEQAKPLQLALRDWHANMPAALKMDDLAARKLSSSGYLHLAYYAVEMTLHRRIIRSLSAVDEPALRSICREAAHIRLESAMAFVQDLRPQHLQSFWYSASKYNFALIGTFIALLLATSTEKVDAALYRAKLDEYRWMLRLSSKSADFLDQALATLASSTGVLVSMVPQHPDAERILNRYQVRAAGPADGEAIRGARTLSMAYRSESEDHAGPSPVDVIGQTHGSSAPADVAWHVDHTWMDAYNEASAAFGTELEFT
ncbi:Fungal specific transcription factor [Coniothyrium glycines]